MAGSKKVFTTLGSSNHALENREAFDYYATDPKAVEMLLELEQFTPGFFEELYANRDDNFGNAREVRNLFERLISAQSDRVAALEAPNREDLMAFTLADFQAAQAAEY